MGRILVTTAMVALVAGLLLGSPDSAAGSDRPAIQAAAGSDVRPPRVHRVSCPCADSEHRSWQPPYQPRRAPDLDRKRIRARDGHPAVAGQGARWWWTALWPW